MKINFIINSMLISHVDEITDEINYYVINFINYVLKLYYYLTIVKNVT